MHTSAPPKSRAGLLVTPESAPLPRAPSLAQPQPQPPPAPQRHIHANRNTTPLTNTTTPTSDGNARKLPTTPLHAHRYNAPRTPRPTTTVRCLCPHISPHRHHPPALPLRPHRLAHVNRIPSSTILPTTVSCCTCASAHHLCFRHSHLRRVSPKTPPPPTSCHYSSKRSRIHPPPSPKLLTNLPNRGTCHSSPITPEPQACKFNASNNPALPRTQSYHRPPNNHHTPPAPPARHPELILSLQSAQAQTHLQRQNSTHPRTFRSHPGRKPTIRHWQQQHRAQRRARQILGPRQASAHGNQLRPNRAEHPPEWRHRAPEAGRAGGQAGRGGRRGFGPGSQR